MHGDEEATMATLSARRAVVDELIARHRGRIANTAGDSVLAEFASVLDAVRCAIEIQAALQTANDARTGRATDALPDWRQCRRCSGISLALHLKEAVVRVVMISGATTPRNAPKGYQRAEYVSVGSPSTPLRHSLGITYDPLELSRRVGVRGRETQRIATGKGDQRPRRRPQGPPRERAEQSAHKGDNR